jgi:uncharacterized protein (TIGR03000 family)
MMYATLLIAALSFPRPIDCLPAPVKQGIEGLPVVPEFYPLTVPPIPHSTDASPGDCPFPLAPRPGADRQTDFPNQAILIIKLPPDADLYVNTVHIRSVTNRRTFVTVDLPPGQAFYYDLKVRVVREFRPFVQWQRVIFRAGESVVVCFGDVPCGLPFTLGWH